jgi:predicted O-methyltransferase YrrM
MIALQKSPVNGYLCPTDPGEPGWGTQRLSVNDLEAKIVSEFARGKTVLEIGTGLGVSTLKLAETAKMVYTVDIDSWVAKNIAPTLPDNVRFFKSIDEYGITPGFDMAFVDGFHEYEQCSKDINSVMYLVNRGGVLLFHDFHIPAVAKAIHDSHLNVVYIRTIAGMGLAWNDKGDNQ